MVERNIYGQLRYVAEEPYGQTSEPAQVQDIEGGIHYTTSNEVQMTANQRTIAGYRR